MMNQLVYVFKICSHNYILYRIMAQSKAITQARQAMLDLIKSKASTINSTSKNKSGSGSSSDTQPKNKQNK